MDHVKPLFPLNYTRILLPVDCTPASRQAVRNAARFAMGVTGANITLVAMVPPTLGDDAASGRLRADRESHADAALETGRAILRQCGIYSHAARQEAPSLAEAAAREAAMHAYDMIVTGNCEHAPHGGLPVLVLPSA